MNDRKFSLVKNLDWVSILLFTLLVFIGWFNVYAAAYSENHTSILDMNREYGRQFIWICTSFGLGILILLTDSKFFTSFSYIIYGITILLLMSVLVFGKEVNGARSWFEIGGIRLQPAEFAKFATTLAVANFMSQHNFKMMKFSNIIILGIILAIPAGLIILQNDTGSALVYSSFIFVFYREGLHGSILLLYFVAIILFIVTILYSSFFVLLLIILGSLIAYYYYRHNIVEVFRIMGFIGLLYFIGVALNQGFGWNIDDFYILLVSSFVLTLVGLFFIIKKRMKNIAILLLVSWLCLGVSESVEHIYEVLQPHQQERINILLGIDDSPKGAGYNVRQSKIAIGSGGFLGKGYMQGTQTQLNFVPEQSTDFIFCTVGEEWGFVGSTIVILLFMTLILRIVFLAERQRSAFSRIYGYGVASILFFHTAINIGMTIGLMPVIGIPLPFFSYGGSSLWSFTILIFIFLRLDANRLQVFR